MNKPWAAYGCEELDRGLGALTSGVAVQAGARADDYGPRGCVIGGCDRPDCTVCDRYQEIPNPEDPFAE